MNQLFFNNHNQKEMAGINQPKRSKKQKILRRLLIIMTVVVLLLVGGGFYWINDGYDPMEQALGALESSEDVIVSDEGRWIHFLPDHDDEGTETRTGLIYYPGARVDHRSYAPKLHDLAAEGIEGFLVDMPLDLAILGSNRALEVMEENQQIDQWIVGGHSLGGAMAARFVDNHRDRVAGLIFFDSYPASSNDLSGAEDLEVLSIYGDREGFVTEEDIENARQYVPGNTRWLRLEGGNHSQFGWYGFQRGDGEATITREEQQQKILEGIFDWLEAAENLR
ncbi:alpha/beta fold hydrolase [Isachenkonia alkalipeptolytica]|uniref:Alpha/beta hydrolase n=1 Tax=Isachenkonia alkalipeptolytica TaxID=2565777 RepID=A0AA44BD21_9CLOT|nr:alpha/beta fold hydrolase [Isachenkonia alkalipeptolytica]NBG87522.1 alpha/beta hydrolase [Isachenkonia alkalipeptolytica]